MTPIKKHIDLLCENREIISDIVDTITSNDDEAFNPDSAPAFELGTIRDQSVLLVLGGPEAHMAVTSSEGTQFDGCGSDIVCVVPSKETSLHARIDELLRTNYLEFVTALYLIQCEGICQADEDYEVTTPAGFDAALGLLLASSEPDTSYSFDLYREHFLKGVFWQTITDDLRIRAEEAIAYAWSVMHGPTKH